MSFLKKLFGGVGGGGSSAAPPEVHNGFTIHVEPMKDGGTWRIAARIEKDVNGEVKVHRMVRADTLQSLDDANAASLAKAKMLIDQQGEQIFS